MLGRKARIGLALCVAAPLGVVGAGGEEKGKDKAKPLVCSIARGVECSGDLDCRPPTEKTNAPTFIHVDPDKKMVTLLGPPSRRGETTRIQAMERKDGRITLSGVEAGRGWSMVITESTGSMTLAVADPDAAFLVFGRCLCADETTP